MIDDLSLTHAEQQQAVERIQALMAQGMSTAAAIQQVSEEIRKEKGAPRNNEE